MREVITYVYGIEELAGKSKERALDEYRDFNVLDDYWYEMMTATPDNPGNTGPYFDEHSGGHFYDDARKLGMEISCIEFTGFGNQGDGLCFDAMIGIEDYILTHSLGRKYRLLLNAARRDGGTIYVCSDGHYSHAETMRIDHDRSDTEFSTPASKAADEENYQMRLYIQIAGLYDHVLYHTKSLARDFYARLEEEYFYQTSDEAVEESLIANEVEFTEEGGRA